MTATDFEFVPVSQWDGLSYEAPEQPAALREWVEDVPALIAGLPLRLPAGMPLDGSRESLVELNAFVLARFPDKASVWSDDELTLDLIIRLSAYLGETWLSVGGGCWHYDTAPGSAFVQQLVVYPAVQDGLPKCPRTSISASASRRVGDMFTRVYDSISQEVAARQAQDPSWRPWRVPTPGYTLVPTQGTPAHEQWVGEMDHSIATYIASLPPTVDWDLSPASASALEHVLLERHPDLSSWRAAPQAEQDGAARYLGEVLRRAVDGAWEVGPGPVRGDNCFAGRPLVAIGDGHDSYAVSPHLLLESLVGTRASGRLDAHLP